MINTLKNTIKRALHTSRKTKDEFHEKTKEELLERLDEPFRSTLLSMYDGAPQRGIDGERHHLDGVTKISPSQGMWIYDFCRSTKPESTLEIGMAYGFSTLFILAALAKNLKGQHTAVDPFQKSRWHGIGLILANEHSTSSSAERAFRLIEDFSVRASTDLAREEQHFDLVFIDGNHRYDDVLVDFFLCAQMTSIGGHVILDDMWMSSVKTAVEFIRTNRTDFREVVSTSSNACVFQKVSEDTRRWDEFTEFKVFPSARSAS
jgi:predicted O-methyltransferase YrrM